MVFKSFLLSSLVAFAMAAGSALAFDLECEFYSEELDRHIQIELYSAEINDELFFVGSSAPAQLGQWGYGPSQRERVGEDQVTCRAVEREARRLAPRDQRWTHRTGVSDQAHPNDSRSGTLFNY